MIPSADLSNTASSPDSSSSSPASPDKPTTITPSKTTSITNSAALPSPTSNKTASHQNSSRRGPDGTALHPRVAVILGVDRKWYIPLLVCRALSTVPAAWWGLRCAFTFLAELLQIRPGILRAGWTAAIVGSLGGHWDVERRFRVTEVALAIMWVCENTILDLLSLSLFFPGGNGQASK